MRASRVATTAVALFLSFSGLAPGSAAAQAGMGEAEQYFHDGERHYENGDFESAIASFSRAYELLAGNPERHLVLYNIGRCQERLFRYDEALNSYQAFVQQARGGERVADARQRIAALARDLATLQITSNARADVWIDDHDTGQQAPGNVRVASGRHVVELRAHGYAPGRQDVQVAPRTVVPLTYRLDRTFAGLHPAFAIAGGGLALASVGVAAGFAGVALGQRGDIDDRLASADPRERFQVTDEVIADMEQNALVADVLFGVAGGFALATVVLLFLTDWGGGASDQAAGPRLVPYASETEVGVALGGRL